MRAGATGTSTIDPWTSSNPSVTAQDRLSEGSAVPLPWMPVVLLASSVDPPPSLPAVASLQAVTSLPAVVSLSTVMSLPGVASLPAVASLLIISLAMMVIASR